MDDKDSYIAELLAEIKSRDRRMDELRREINDQNELITALREETEDLRDTLERFKDTFDLVPDKEPDTVTNGPLIDRLDAAQAKNYELIQLYNKLIRFVRARVLPRPMGRPLAASPEQRRRILAYRDAGHSLNWIAEEMNLGLQTVRTVCDKRDRVDRTTMDRWQRIAPDMRQERDRRRRRQDVDGLRKRIPALMESSAELIKRAKGLK